MQHIVEILPYNFCPEVVRDMSLGLPVHNVTSLPYRLLLCALPLTLILMHCGLQWTKIKPISPPCQLHSHI